MNKKLIAGLIIGAVLLLGTGAWYYTSSNSDDSVSSTFSAEEITNFLNPYSQPVTMTATVVDSAESSNNGTFTMQFQDENTWAMNMETPEGNTEIIFADDYTYMQNPEDGSWLRLPSSGDIDSPEDDFTITDEEIEDFRTNAVATGKSDCSLGTCETFDYTDPLTGEKAVLKVGSGGRIAEMIITTDTSSITMVFDYDSNVNIQIPSDYTELDIPQ